MFFMSRRWDSTAPRSRTRTCCALATVLFRSFPVTYRSKLLSPRWRDILKYFGMYFWIDVQRFPLIWRTARCAWQVSACHTRGEFFEDDKLQSWTTHPSTLLTQNTFSDIFFNCYQWTTVCNMQISENECGLYLVYSSLGYTHNDSKDA